MVATASKMAAIQRILSLRLYAFVASSHYCSARVVRRDNTQTAGKKEDEDDEEKKLFHKVGILIGW